MPAKDGKHGPAKTLNVSDETKTDFDDFRAQLSAEKGAIVSVDEAVGEALRRARR